MRLLVVGFEARAVRGLRRGLVAAGHHVVARRRGGESLVDGADARFDALLLDGALADAAGLAWLRELRGRGLTTAVVFVAADAPVGTRVAALRAGADDVVPAPCHLEELLARLDAVWRRVLPGDGRRALGPLTLDARRRLLIGPAGSVRVTPRELGLLYCLADGLGRTVDRRDILHEVWGRGVAVGPNVIDVYVGYLRDKLGRVAADGVAIETERAAGYRLVVAAPPVPTGRA